MYDQVPALHPGILGRSDNEGADAVKQAVSGSLGLSVDYYVLVNLAGFEQIVDAMGGVTVNINVPIPVGGRPGFGIPPESLSGARAPTSGSTVSRHSGSPADATAPTTTSGWSANAA